MDIIDVVRNNWLSLVLASVSILISWRLWLVSRSILGVLKKQEKVLSSQLDVFTKAVGAIDKTHQAMQVQIEAAHKSRDVEIALAILQRYNENRDLIKMRLPIYTCASEINSELAKYPAPGTDVTDHASKKIGNSGLSLADVEYFIICLDHQSFIIDRLLSETLQVDFYHNIIKPWRHLRPIVERLRSRRKTKLWAKNLVSLATRMESEEFIERVKAAGLEPLAAQDNVNNGGSQGEGQGEG